LRPGRFEFSRLAWALGVSLLIHLLSFGGYELGKQLNWWQRAHLPSWLEKTALLMPAPKPPPPPEETPLMFVDVNPQLATTEAPKDTKFYSDKNSQAANPDADKDTNVPKITGQQTDIVKTEDVQRSKFDKLQPVFPKAEQEQPPEKARPKTPDTPGDLAMAKPDITLRQDTGTAEQSRPRTITEALMRQNRNQLVGQKMKQDGGASRHLEFTSLDAKATPFGAYDAAFIEAVEQRWFDLLDNMSYDGYKRGRVVLQFRLNYNGTITDVKVVDENVGLALSLMCQKAITDPSPFDKWPREMRLMVDKDYREIQFAFYYN
jgi:outer membrane biosynthesis protein TonB